MNYYNEFDPFAAQWLRELIADGLLPPGDVDDRSIVDVRGADLRGYVQCHFFAGIGGWPYALRLAGWSDNRPAWTGSCPCQPFSVAGKGEGTHDERHLWPEFRRLIRECRPEHVFGEQVGGAAGELWLAGVQLDLEEDAYRFGAAGLCAAGVGAPHIRSRLYWLAHTEDTNRRAGECTAETGIGTNEERRWGSGSDGATRGLAHDDDDGPHRQGGLAAIAEGDGQDGRLHRGSARGLADALGERGRGGDAGGEHAADVVPPGAVGWARFSLIRCGDGKTRRIPVEPSFFPLVDGSAPGRVGILRGAGNAIVAPLAAEFVAAWMDIEKARVSAGLEDGAE